jgi:hypothetical protein
MVAVSIAQSLHGFITITIHLYTSQTRNKIDRDLRQKKGR